MKETLEYMLEILNKIRRTEKHLDNVIGLNNKLLLSYDPNNDLDNRLFKKYKDAIKSYNKELTALKEIYNENLSKLKDLK